VEPQYWPVSWTRTGEKLCIDDDNAKSLVKNIEILRSHRDELLGILRELKARSVLSQMKKGD